MFTVILIVALAAVIFAISVRLQGPNADRRLPLLLLLSYALRLAISPLTITLNLFTSASTDFGGYETRAEFIAHLWRYTGIHYVTADEFPELQQVSLPSNIYACIIYLSGGPTHLGCTAVVAAVAALACLNVYLLAIELGARSNVALWTTALVSVLPSFLFYTSSTFKDGFVTLFVLGILGCAIRLARKFSFWQLALAILFSVGLWSTRYYLLFIVPPPLLLGLLGLRSRSILRTVLAILVMGASASALYAYSAAPDVVVHRATRTFDVATSENVLTANAEAGSGVTFESTSPNATFAFKLLYTLFSPFPWQSGSVGLQIGKLEALVWYFFAYRAFQAAKAMWWRQRSDLLVFMSLVVPMTVAYAFTFSNIGLIVRQRIDIVLTTMILATLSWGRQQEETSKEQLRLVPQAA